MLPEANANLISPTMLLCHLGFFTLVMILSTLLVGRRQGTQSGEAFLVVNRDIPWWLGGPSIAASWTWAVALMISVQMAYQQGLAGVFWFTVPNIAAVLIYIWLGPQIRRKLPEGYSLPEWMHARFGDT
jgi:Na+/proline symporter